MTPYIYAPPRIGTNQVSDLYRIYPYTNPKDPVPHLPPLNLSYEDPKGAEDVVPPEEKVAFWKLYSKLFRHHAIERYRVELGEKTKDEKFAPDVFFTALFTEMIDTYRALGQPFPFGLRN